MRSFVIFGAAAFVAASPAPQAFDVNQLNAVPATLTKGAPVGVGPTSQANVYNQAAAISTAEAAASGPTKAPANNKRGVEARTYGYYGGNQGHSGGGPPGPPAGGPLPPGGPPGGPHGGPPGPPAGGPPPPGGPHGGPPGGPPPPPGGGYYTGPQQTPTPSVTQPSTTTGPAVTPTPSNVVPSTCTPVDWTNTWSFTSDTATACPTAIEIGTFCGFINPLDPCAPQPAAYGPPTVPDTVEAFEKNPVYSKKANEAKTPSGYVQTFKNLNAAVNANSYLAYKILESYDVASCAAYCDETEHCGGFNVFIERDPAWNPDQCSCKNPTSIAQYKCSIFGSGVEESAATNTGEYRDEFQVVIVGSNGYEKSAGTPPETVPGYDNPQNCGTKLHNQPRYCIGEKSFPGPFDASLCAAYATAQNAINVKAGFFSKWASVFGFSNGKCQQFQAAELEVDGAAWGTHCRLFTKKFDKSQANLDISIGAGGSSKLSCGKSFTYDLSAHVEW